LTRLVDFACMNFIKLLMIVIFLYTNLLAQKKCGSNTQTMKKIEYKKAVSSYITLVSKKIAQQLEHNIVTYKKAVLLIKIKPIVNLYDPKKSSIATKKIAENLIHEMFIAGFQVVENEDSADSYMSGTYINYKNGMLINARVIDKKSGYIYSSAQLFLSKKELKSINKIYNKYSWFSETN